MQAASKLVQELYRLRALSTKQLQHFHCWHCLIEVLQEMQLISNPVVHIML